MTQTLINFDAPRILPTDPNVIRDDVDRLAKQNERVLARLRFGDATARELMAVALNYRARISDLRKMGHRIKCDRKPKGLTVYHLVRDGEGVVE